MSESSFTAGALDTKSKFNLPEVKITRPPEQYAVKVVRSNDEEYC